MLIPFFGAVILEGEVISDPAFVVIAASFGLSVLAIFFRPRSPFGGMVKILLLLAGLLASVIALLIPQVLFRGYEGVTPLFMGYRSSSLIALFSPVGLASLNFSNTKDVLELILTVVTIILNLTQINLTLIQINQASKPR